MWSVRSCGVLACAATSLVLAACGGNARQDASEPTGKFSVEVTTASFPLSQSLSQHAHLVITVHNADSRTIPNVAVTITDGDLGTQSQAFGELIDMPGLASRSRPVWIVDHALGYILPGLPGKPARCPRNNGQPGAVYNNNYSDCTGGPGGAVTAYANTWSVGPLAPGKIATFDWTVTAVKPGTHIVNYVVAGGLNGKAVAQLANGGVPKGTFKVTVHGTPEQAYVNDKGQIVKTK
jgi:hypothetical protein